MWAPPGVSVRCVGWIGLRSTTRILENGRECSSEYIVYNSPYGVVDWVAQDPLCWEPLYHPIIQQCFPQWFLNAQSILIAPQRDHPPPLEKIPINTLPAVVHRSRLGRNLGRRFRVRHRGKYPEWTRAVRPAGTSTCTGRCWQSAPKPGSRNRKANKR